MVDFRKRDDYYIYQVLRMSARTNLRKEGERMWTAIYMLRPVTRCKEGCHSWPAALEGGGRL